MVLPYLPAPRVDLPVLHSANFSSFSSLHVPGFTEKTLSLCPGLLVPSAAGIPVPLELLVLSPVLDTALEPRLILSASLSLLQLGSRDQNIFELL